MIKVKHPGKDFVLAQVSFSDDMQNIETFDADEFPIYKHAPEILKALKSLLKTCSCSNNCDPKDMTCATNQARAVIAKLKR